MEKDAEILEVLIRELVDNQEDVKVERAVDEMGVLLSVHLNAEDMGKIIGREGTIAKALRTIIRAIGMKNGARVNIKIVEPPGSTFKHDAVNIYPGDVTSPRENQSITL